MWILYEKETGINSQKCPLYLDAARVAVTAAVKSQVLCDGRDKEMITLMVLLLQISVWLELRLRH